MRPAGNDGAAYLMAQAPVFERQLRLLAAHGAAFARIEAAEAAHVPPAPRWRQDWFARLDAAMAYAIVAQFRPARIVEVGCGHSTRFMAQAISDHALATQFTAIDPAPRASLEGLQVNRHAQHLQECDIALFTALRPGDIAFFDSSHVYAPASDVALIFERILPRLAPGVVVHFHDVFLPDGYPAAWAGRLYNEQQFVAGLFADGGYDALFASHFVVTRMRAAFNASCASALPLADGAHESSLWLRKRYQP